MVCHGERKVLFFFIFFWGGGMAIFETFSFLLAISYSFAALFSKQKGNIEKLQHQILFAGIGNIKGQITGFYF